MKGKSLSLKLMTVAGICFLLTATSQARTTTTASFSTGTMNLDVWAGYTSTFMYGLNEELSDWREVLDFWGYDDELEVSSAGSAMDIGVNFDFALNDRWQAGPRLVFLTTFPAEVRGLSRGPAYRHEWTNTFSANMLALAGGLVFTPYPPDPYISFSVGMDLGMAFMFGNWKSKYETNDPYWPTNMYNYDIPLAGNCLYWDLNVLGSYHFDNEISAYLRLGYRIADMDFVNVTRNVENIVPYPDLEAGDKFEGLDDDPIPFDFSGFEIGVGVQIVL